jgi:hypothetical protein
VAGRFPGPIPNMMRPWSLKLAAELMDYLRKTWGGMAELQQDPIQNLPLNTKGDLLTVSGGELASLSVGDDDEIIVADSTVAAGIRWEEGPNVQLTVRYDEVTDTIAYVGEAPPGAVESEAVWRVKRLDSSVIEVDLQFADGDKNFDNIWGNRAALSYS